MSDPENGVRYSIEAVRIIGHVGLHRIGVDHAHQILWISPMTDGGAKPNHPTLNVSGDWVSLGGIDLQINGGLGLAFPDLHHDTETLQKITDYLYDQGVDGFLPTLVTTSNEKVHHALGCLAGFRPQGSRPTAKILGTHLEGPFLNASKRGAHPKSYIQPLTLDRVKAVLGDYASETRVMTLAPELDPSGTTLKFLRSQNIVVSLGHSLATAAEAQRAFAQGATMVTHAFNAMPPLHHREPGLLGAADCES